MEVIKRKITDLVFDPVNARKHPTKSIDAIKSSLVKFGQQKPIIIDEKGIVVAGNGTLAAAKELGWKEIICIVTKLNDLNKMAYALADNRTAEMSEWDFDIVQQQLAQLEMNDIDLDDIGFKDFNLDHLDDDKDDDNDDYVEKKSGKYELLLTFNNETEQQQIFNECQKRKIECVIL